MAYDISQKGKLSQQISQFKQELKEYSQVKDIYFNHKRFQVVSYQTMAKHLFDTKDFVNAYTIAYVADKLPGFLENHDHVYMEVSQIN